MASIHNFFTMLILTIYSIWVTFPIPTHLAYCINYPSGSTPSNYPFFHPLWKATSKIQPSGRTISAMEWTSQYTYLGRIYCINFRPSVVDFQELLIHSQWLFSRTGSFITTSTMISGRPRTCTKSEYLVLIYSEKKYIHLLTENINDEDLSKFGH